MAPVLAGRLVLGAFEGGAWPVIFKTFDEPWLVQEKEASEVCRAYRLRLPVLYYAQPAVALEPSEFDGGQVLDALLSGLPFELILADHFLPHGGLYHLPDFDECDRSTAPE